MQIPSVLYPEGHPNRSLGGGLDGKKLIEEVGLDKTHMTRDKPEIPSWTWTKTSTKIKIIINVPNLTHAHIPTSILDLEPRRIILSIPPLYVLDVNLDASDAEIVATFSDAEDVSRLDADGTKGKGAESALTLKRIRDLELGNASAEWRVGEGVIVVYA